MSKPPTGEPCAGEPHSTVRRAGTEKAVSDPYGAFGILRVSADTAVRPDSLLGQKIFQLNGFPTHRF